MSELRPEGANTTSQAQGRPLSAADGIEERSGLLVGDIPPHVAGEFARMDAKAILEIWNHGERVRAAEVIGWNADGNQAYDAELRRVAPNIHQLASAQQGWTLDGAYSYGQVDRNGHAETLRGIRELRPGAQRDETRDSPAASMRAVKQRQAQFEGGPTPEAFKTRLSAMDDVRDYLRTAETTTKQEAAVAMRDNASRDPQYRLALQDIQRSLPEPIIAPANEWDSAAREAIERKRDGLLAIPQHSMKESDARTMVRQDVSLWHSISDKDEKFMASVAMADTSRNQEAYKAELDRQAPGVAQHLGEAVREDERRQLAKEGRKLQEFPQHSMKESERADVAAADPFASRSSAQPPEQRNELVTVERQREQGLTARDAVVGAAHTAQLTGVGGAAGHLAAQGVGVVDAVKVAKDLAEGKDVRPIDAATAAASVALTAGATGPVAQGATVIGLAGAMDTTLRASNTAGQAVDAASAKLSGDRQAAANDEQKEPTADDIESQRRRRALQLDPNQPELRPIFERAGYELPKAVSNHYVNVDGKFFVKEDTSKAAFEDKGKSLSTGAEDRLTIASMVAVAKAKAWTELELKGTEAFRRQAWLEAESQGLSTRGYKPKEQDLAALEAMRQERGTNRITSLDDGSRAPSLGEKQGRGVTSPQAEADKASGRTDTNPADRGTPQGTAALSGVLVEHGRAPYNDDPKERASYFVTVQSGEVKQKVWGVDLERAMRESGAKTGDPITLENLGRKDVAVQVPVRDQAGTVVGHEWKNTHRNEWKVSPADALKIRAAERVLEDAIATRPAGEREALRASFTREIDRQVAAGKIDLPAPLVHAPEQTREPAVRSERTR